MLWSRMGGTGVHLAFGVISRTSFSVTYWIGHDLDVTPHRTTMSIGYGIYPDTY